MQDKWFNMWFIFCCVIIFLTGEEIHQLATNPLFVAVYDESKTINLLQYNRRSKRVFCTCQADTGAKNCQHTKLYFRWRGDGYGEEGEDEAPKNTSSTFKSVSWDRVPYPLPAELQEVCTCTSTLHAIIDVLNCSFSEGVVPIDLFRITRNCG